MSRFMNLKTMAGLLVASLWSVSAAAQSDMPYECDDEFDQCGTPEQSGGGGGGGGGGSVLINNTDVGVTYQFADDYDDDGVEDPYDNCPFVYNQDQMNADGDLYGNVCDNCPNVANADQSNIDGDAMGDACDSDMDGDGVENSADNCISAPNPNQDNADGDQEGDACDDDMDNDGIANLEDECPLLAGAPGESVTDVMCDRDDDGDTIRNTKDNCPQKPNYEQENSDDDVMGDACDPDMDNDGVQNEKDNCPMIANSEQTDGDRDGAGDACDDKFCLVVYGDTVNCLDPAMAFAVHTPSFSAVETGSEIPLMLFANRENAEINYILTVETAPSGSSAVIKKPTGSVSESKSYMYQYTAGTIPRIVPDEPGTYKIKLSAQLNGTDSVTGTENPSAVATGLIVVTGKALDDGNGCAVVAPGATHAGFGTILLAGLLLLGMAIRLRRR